MVLTYGRHAIWYGYLYRQRTVFWILMVNFTIEATFNNT